MSSPLLSLSALDMHTPSASNVLAASTTGLSNSTITPSLGELNAVRDDSTLLSSPAPFLRVQDSYGLPGDHQSTNNETTLSFLPPDLRRQAQSEPKKTASFSDSVCTPKQISELTTNDFVTLSCMRQFAASKSLDNIEKAITAVLNTRAIVPKPKEHEASTTRVDDRRTDVGVCGPANLLRRFDPNIMLRAIHDTITLYHDPASSPSNSITRVKHHHSTHKQFERVKTLSSVVDNDDVDKNAGVKRPRLSLFGLEASAPLELDSGPPIDFSRHDFTNIKHADSYEATPAFPPVAALRNQRRDKNVSGDEREHTRGSEIRFIPERLSNLSSSGNHLRTIDNRHSMTAGSSIASIEPNRAAHLLHDDDLDLDSFLDDMHDDAKR